MSCLQGQYQCFWCLISVSVSSAGTDIQKRLSSPLKCCSCYFCTMFRQKGAEMLSFPVSGWTKSDRSDSSGLEQPVVSDLTVSVLIFIIQKEQKAPYTRDRHRAVWKSWGTERIVWNSRSRKKTHKKDIHDKNTGIALKYSHEVKEIVSFIRGLKGRTSFHV